MSTSRTARSITVRPAAWAASRATLPALCPWRTIQSLAGHLCRIAQEKREALESSEQAVGLQPAAKAVGAGEQVRVHPDRPRAFDVDLPVVDEQGVGRIEAEAVEGAKV
jgi:hypothetical protein